MFPCYVFLKVKIFSCMLLKCPINLKKSCLVALLHKLSCSYLQIILSKTQIIIIIFWTIFCSYIIKKKKKNRTILAVSKISKAYGPPPSSKISACRCLVWFYLRKNIYNIVFTVYKIHLRLNINFVCYNNFFWLILIT